MIFHAGKAKTAMCYRHCRQIGRMESMRAHASISLDDDEGDTEVESRAWLSHCRSIASRIRSFSVRSERPPSLREHRSQCTGDGSDALYRCSSRIPLCRVWCVMGTDLIAPALSVDRVVVKAGNRRRRQKHWSSRWRMSAALVSNSKMMLHGGCSISNWRRRI